MNKEKAKTQLNYIMSLLFVIFLSLLIGAIIMLLNGKSPVVGYSALFNGAFGTKRYIANTFSKTVPLILTGLATSMAFNAGISNIGGEGQLYLGAFAAAYVGFTFTALPKPIGFALAVVAGAIAGGIYAFFPGFLKVKFKINEVITTIMLNSVALHFTNYLVNYPFEPKTGKINGTEAIAEHFFLTKYVKLSTLNSSIIYMAMITILIYYLMKKTSTGYEYTIVGQNSEFAKYGGVNAKKRILQAMVISGALCGIAGAFEVFGVHHRFLQNISPGYAWDGMLAALIVKNNPIGTVFMCIFLAALKTGSVSMENTTAIPSELVMVIQSIIILFIAGESGIKSIIDNFMIKRKTRKKVGEESA